MQQRSLKRKNLKNLTIAASAPTPAPIKPNNVQGTGFVANSRNPPQREPQPVQSLSEDEIEHIANIGFGNGGSVAKVWHRPSQMFMARKTFFYESDERTRRAIQTELEILKICQSPFIVKFYGQFVEQYSIVVCMEYMDCGSLDRIYKTIGPLNEFITSYINAAVVDGLLYLKGLNIIHRDIKPSNILVNRKGEVKLCDFGVSGHLINSMVQSFVGTSLYMSPERIIGEEYTTAGDVWSLGLTLIELLTGRYPLGDPQEQLPVFEKLQRIVAEPQPSPPEHCSSVCKDYINKCLVKDKNQRINIKALPQTPFYLMARLAKVRNPLIAWAADLPLI